MSLENVNSQKSVQDAQAPAKSTKAEASATLLKRGSMQRPSENTLRSLDLALPVSSPKDKVRVTTDFVYNINTIELSQLDSTRTKGLRQFSPISSLNRPPESGTPEQRAVVRTQVNNLLNTITKKTVELPKGVITKEQQIGTVFNENIKGVLTGLKTINTESARNTLKALTHGGKILDASGIQDLLRSSGKADQKKGMEALKALSNLCKDSQLLSTAVRKSTAFSSNVSGNTLDPIQVQTQFIKSARSMLTNTFFQTKVSEDLDKISVKFKDTATNTDKTVTLPEGGINKYLANVGFNRLMSENNMLGASLSSDVDFKLVLDDEILKTDIKIANPGMTDEQAGKAVNDLKDQIVKTLEGTKETFEGDFNLTLEVQSFTVKSVSTLKRDAGTSDVEQNFLATVLHNNSYMSGNPQVMDKFVGIIKDNLTFNKVATRNFEQYLGDSDKGSIKAIKNLPQMEAVVSSAADIITASPDLTARAKTILHLDDSTTTEQLKQKLTSDPGLLKKLVTDKGDTTIKATLTNNDTIKNNLGNVDMFKGADLGEKLALTCKLVTTFTKTTEGEQNRNFIGREGVGANDNWVFSVKYAGCRLNDVFDSTPREVYAMSSNNVVKATKTFDDVKTIAEAINSFSIQIQNRTYEMESAKGTSHNDIDEMYDRVTGNEFASMVKDANTLPKLRTMVDNLVQSLTDSGSGSKEIMGTDNLKKLAEVQTALKDSGVTSLSDDQLRSLGHKLFDTMFTVTDKAANALKPEPPKVRYSHSQTV